MVRFWQFSISIAVGQQSRKCRFSTTRWLHPISRNHAWSAMGYTPGNRPAPASLAASRLYSTEISVKRLPDENTAWLSGPGLSNGSFQPGIATGSPGPETTCGLPASPRTPMSATGSEWIFGSKRTTTTCLLKPLAVAERLSLTQPDVRREFHDCLTFEFASAQQKTRGSLRGF